MIVFAEQFLLQLLNDQNRAAIKKCLKNKSLKSWINNPVLLELLENPVRQFNNVENITCLIFASLVSDDATVRQLVKAGADVTVTDSRGYGEEVFSALHYACASDVDADAKVAYLMQRDETSQTV